MGTVNPRAHVYAAQIGANSAEMAAQGQRVKAAILIQAARHNKTGDYMSAVRVRRSPGPTVRDTIVETTDPNALSIEYGHWWVIDGVRIKWVQGIRIFNKAFNILKRG